MINKYGYYLVGKEKYYSCMLAHIAASKTKEPIYWFYHEDIFAQVNRENLGKNSLDFFYRQRALQLRDLYDYLILNYSGGSDSHNILMTFINNNIKLDQITVRLPFSALNNNVHKANRNDTSQLNRYSEWDFTIKPMLEWVSENHPNIKIVLLDWLDESAMNSLKEDSFTDPRGGYFLGSMLRSANFAVDPGEREMLDKGKSVALLWGIDKPRLVSAGTDTGDKVYMSLKDKPMVISSPTIHNPNGTEYFYWSPEMPDLAWEMAYKTFKFFDINKDLRHVIQKVPGKGHAVSHAKWQKFCDLTSTVLYTTWDRNKFQVDKPSWGVKSDMRPGDAIIETLPELAELKTKWRYYWKSYDRMLDRSIHSIMENGEFLPTATKFHYLGTYS